MLILHSCPRCLGDLCKEEDYFSGMQVSCLQCGYLAFETLQTPAGPPALSRVLRRPAEAKAKVAAIEAAQPALASER